MKLKKALIRQAEAWDVEKAFPLVEAFFKESAAKVGFEFDKRDVESLMAEVSRYHVAIVAEHEGELVGLISGVISASPFCSEQKVFKELFWYVIPEHRGDIGKALYRSCVDYLRAVGVELMIFASHKGGLDSGLDNFYFYEEFSPLETLWIKKI